ncbi:hypothetical protein SH449x_004390 [Pirellulaceae bacterium SH449]
MHTIKLRFFQAIFSWIAISLFSAASIGRDFEDAIGYTRLVSELADEGKTAPNGTGISVGLVEANTSGSQTLHHYLVNSSGAEFTGKTITDLSQITPNGISSHATEVARYFFGNQRSITPGVDNIGLYYANDFIGNKQAVGSQLNPTVVPFRVLNHSFIANFAAADLPLAIQANARMDYTIQRDQFTNVVALNNGTGLLPQIYAQSYNSIVVGRSDGNHSRGVTTINGAHRTKPDIVAPLNATSYATPVVASTATLLHSAAQSFGFHDAQAPEAMKAIIMAGADKDPFPSWSNTSTRPLDSVFGAGQVNVYNSYRILEGGQFEGSSTFTVGDSGLKGWDYREISSSQDLYWNFSTIGGIESASILVTWNADYSDANGDFSVGSFRLADMRLSLHTYDGLSLGQELFFSDSPVDNVEHLYLRNLEAGRYTLRLSSNLDSRFGIAWNITAVPEPGTVLLITSIAGFAIIRLRIKHRR